MFIPRWRYCVDTNTLLVPWHILQPVRPPLVGDEQAPGCAKALQHIEEG
jgi:hypothetical protein